MLKVTEHCTRPGPVRCIQEKRIECYVLQLCVEFAGKSRMFSAIAILNGLITSTQSSGNYEI
jgi:hypothetical protein